MAIIDNKITDSDLSSYGVVSAPDRLTGTANQNKQVFDRLIKQAVKVKINELIDDLLAASAAGQLGASPPSGLSGSTVQAVLQSLKSYVDSTKVAKEPGKGLSQNDYTDADKALVGQIPDKADKTYVDQNMVAQIPGKGLSSNDYTDAEKELVAQIPHKAGTDNVLTKDNTAPFEPTGDYNPCTKKYADDLAFSAGAVTSVFGRAGAVVAQDGDYTPQQVGAEPAFSVLPQSKGGTGQTSLQAARNAMGLGNTLGVLPVANGGTGQSSLANVTTGKSNSLVSPNGSQVAAITDLGGIIFPGIVKAAAFSQNAENFGTPNEIGQFLDMHLSGSDADHDVRMYINPSNKKLFFANPNVKSQQGYAVVNPGNNINAVQKITQSAYEQLSTKDSATVYFSVG